MLKLIILTNFTTLQILEQLKDLTQFIYHAVTLKRQIVNLLLLIKQTHSNCTSNSFTILYDHDKSIIVAWR